MAIVRCPRHADAAFDFAQAPQLLFLSGVEGSVAEVHAALIRRDSDNDNDNDSSGVAPARLLEERVWETGTSTQSESQSKSE